MVKTHVQFVDPFCFAVTCVQLPEISLLNIQCSSSLNACTTFNFCFTFIWFFDRIKITGVMFLKNCLVQYYVYPCLMSRVVFFLTRFLPMNHIWATFEYLHFSVPCIHFCVHLFGDFDVLLFCYCFLGFLGFPFPFKWYSRSYSHFSMSFRNYLRVFLHMQHVPLAFTEGVKYIFDVIKEDIYCYWQLYYQLLCASHSK